MTDKFSKFIGNDAEPLRSEAASSVRDHIAETLSKTDILVIADPDHSRIAPDSFLASPSFIKMAAGQDVRDIFLEIHSCFTPVMEDYYNGNISRDVFIETLRYADKGSIAFGLGSRSSNPEMTFQNLANMIDHGKSHGIRVHAVDLPNGPGGDVLSDHIGSRLKAFSSFLQDNPDYFHSPALLLSRLPEGDPAILKDPVIQKRLEKHPPATAHTTDAIRLRFDLAQQDTIALSHRVNNYVEYANTHDEEISKKRLLDDKVVAERIIQHKRLSSGKSIVIFGQDHTNRLIGDIDNVLSQSARVAVIDLYDSKKDTNRPDSDRCHGFKRDGFSYEPSPTRHSIFLREGIFQPPIRPAEALPCENPAPPKTLRPKVAPG